MSKTLLTFLLSELKTVRLICRKCQTIIEMPTSRLSDTGKGICCPACGAFFPKGQNGQEDHFASLAKAIGGLLNLEQEVEFVIPAKSEKIPAQN